MAVAALIHWIPEDSAAPSLVLQLSFGLGLLLFAVPLVSREVGVWLEQRRWIAFLRQWASSQPSPASPSFAAGLVLLSGCLTRSSAALARAWMGTALFVGGHAALFSLVAVLEDDEQRLSREIILRAAHFSLCLAHLLAVPSLWVSSQAYRQRLKEVRVADKVLSACQQKHLIPRPPGELISMSFELETSVVLNAALFSVLTEALGINSHWSRLGSFAGFEFSAEACREELSQLEVDVCSLEVALVEQSCRSDDTAPGNRVKAERGRVLRKVS